MHRTLRNTLAQHAAAAGAMPHARTCVLPTPSSASPSLPPPDFLSVATCLQVQMNTDPNGDGVGNEYVQFKRRA